MVLFGLDDDRMVKETMFTDLQWIGLAFRYRMTYLLLLFIFTTSSENLYVIWLVYSINSILNIGIGGMSDTTVEIPNANAFIGLPDQ
jgi:hypothetical protein